MPTVTIEYYGMTGQGRTIKEAKADASARLTAFVKSGAPKVYAWRGWVMVAHAHAYGASYVLVAPDHNGQAHSSCSMADLEDAVQSGIRHMLTNARTGLGDMETPDWVKKTDRERILADWRRNDAFQRAYRHAESAGESNPHQWACWHADKFLTAA